MLLIDYKIPLGTHSSGIIRRQWNNSSSIVPVLGQYAISTGTAGVAILVNDSLTRSGAVCYCWCRTDWDQVYQSLLDLKPGTAHCVYLHVWYVKFSLYIFKLRSPTQFIIISESALMSSVQWSRHLFQRVFAPVPCVVSFHLHCYLY